MRKSILFVLAALCFAFASCGKSSNSGSNSEISASDVATISYDSILLYEYVSDSMSQRFYYLDDHNDSTYSESEMIMVSRTQHEEEKEEGLYRNFRHDPVFYCVDPQQRYFYVAHNAHNNSNGWTCNYTVYSYDIRTGHMQQVVPECAAVTRLTNEKTATCTADEVWVMHDEYLDWSGNVVRVDSKEYDYQTMRGKYENIGYYYTKGFNSL